MNILYKIENNNIQKNVCGSYMRIKYADNKEYLFKIQESYHNYYIGKIIGITKPYYNECFYHAIDSDTVYEIISEEEFKELAGKGLDLIRKNII